MQSTEKWLPVVGYEGLYEVSDAGRVRSLGRIDVRGRAWPAQLMKLSRRPNGYQFVQLTSSTTHRRLFAVHRLVAKAFVPNPDALPIVRHWDDDKDNNCASNLLWGTDADNKRDAVRNGKNAFSNRTECINGHPYSAANTRVDKHGHRYCRACNAMRKRRIDRRVGAKVTCPACGELRAVRRVKIHLTKIHGVSEAEAVVLLAATGR